MSVEQLRDLSWERWQPLRLSVGADVVQLETCLRLLPGKRVAAQARFNDELVFAKVFFGARHAQDAAAEARVIQQVAASGIALAELQGSYAGEGFTVVIQQWLPELKPLSGTTDDQLMSAVTEVLGILSQLRAAGLCQRDPHLENFARDQEGQVYFLDAGDVIAAGDSADGPFLNSLALFCAQMPTTSLQQVIEVAANFFAPDITAQALTQRVCRVNRRRIRHALKKWLRACTAIMPFAEGSSAGWLDREHAHDLETIVSLLKNPEQLPLIKRGSRIAVYGDERWVLKCYRDASWRARAKRQFNLSPARRSWRMGWTLDMLGLPTPRPVALLEQRNGEAVLLFPTVAGDRFSEVLEQDRDRAQTLAPQIRASVSAMGQLGLWHGDLKAQNILLPPSGHSLIDLDAAGWSGVMAFARHRHQRDVARFERNWSQFTGQTTEGGKS